MALNYDAITALTRKKYIPELIDNFFNSHALLALLRKREKGYSKFSGYKIVEPLIYGELANVTSYRGYDAITYDQNIPITAAEFDIKHLVAPIAISETEEIENSGDDAKVIDLVESKVRIAEETLKSKFAQQLYGDGTGNSGKDITGLGAAIATTGVYGGIDRATYTWWQAKVKSNSGQVRPLTTRLMRSLFLEISDGPDQPDLIITTDKLWNRYAEIAENKMVISANGRMLADLGFQVLEFMGVPVVADKDCPAGTMFMLNTRYLRLRYSPAANFRTTPWHRADTFVGKKQEILWSGNLTLSNSRRQGKITDLDESGY